MNQPLHDGSNPARAHVFCMVDPMRAETRRPYAMARPCLETGRDEGFAKSSLRRIPLLHPIEGFLQNLQVAGMIEFGPAGLDPFLFQRILSRTIDLVENSKQPGKGYIC
jgi:hypothetical protein